MLAWLGSSIIARARRKEVISAQVLSILESVSHNHHLVDDTPYGGGPGELMKVDVIAPLIDKALSERLNIRREKKRVLLMDPAGQPFTQTDAKRLSTYQDLIFICGRYEGIDARIHHYVDEALSIGDFVLSSGDLAAMAIFDATARMIEGVLGNPSSMLYESHFAGRLEGSHYTRPSSYDGHDVPQVFQDGNHAEIERARMMESVYRTCELRPDLIERYPLDHSEKELLMSVKNTTLAFPWQKHDE